MALAVVGITQQQRTLNGAQPSGMSIPSWVRFPTNQGHESLLVWNYASGRATELWRRSPEFSDIDSVAWMPSGNNILAIVIKITSPESKDYSRQSIPVLINAQTRKVTKILESETSPIDWAQVTVSDSQDLAIVSASSYNGEVTRTNRYLIDGQGRILRTVGSTSGLGEESERLVADQLYYRKYERDPDKPRTSIGTWYQMNVRTGREEKLDRPPQTAAIGETADLKLSLNDAKVGGIASLTSPNSLNAGASITVSKDATMASLSPLMNAIAYSSDGATFVAPIVKVSPEVVRQHKDSLERMEAIMNAKQIALAMISYSADYDDQLPDKATWAKDLSPYVKSERMFSEFVYSYNGPPKFTEIKEPSRTELGYIKVPGGRAVAFADGSVRFLADKKPG